MATAEKSTWPSCFPPTVRYFLSITGLFPTYGADSGPFGAGTPIATVFRAGRDGMCNSGREWLPPDLRIFPPALTAIKVVCGNGCAIVVGRVVATRLAHPTAFLFATSDRLRAQSAIRHGSQIQPDAALDPTLAGANRSVRRRLLQHFSRHLPARGTWNVPPAVRSTHHSPRPDRYRLFRMPRISCALCRQWPHQA